MPWQVTFNQDTEVPGTGTATAAFTDDAGKLIVSHSDRLAANGADNTIPQFIDAALKKYQQALDRNTETASVLTKIQAVLTEKTT